MLFNLLTGLITFTTFAFFAPVFWRLSSEDSFLGRGFIGKLGRALSNAASTTVLDPGYKRYSVSVFFRKNLL